MEFASTDAPLRRRWDGAGAGPSAAQPSGPRLGQECSSGNPSCCCGHFMSKPFYEKI